ncbi:hypothetical protein AB0E88_31865 [Streptomyces sp. NPDC028635]|uniref:hypothetical protein n=1 Tax=Streptomyces sp. NPDC028635 TaxID=3154800 RepID=UPI0033FD0DD3
MRGLAMWGTALAALGAVAVGGPAGAAVALTGPEDGQGVRQAVPEDGPQAGQGVREAGREADLVYHGSVVLGGGRVHVELTPRNLGPAAVPEAAVRLRWSVPLADSGQRLPGGCVRTAERDLVCRTGALTAGEVGERIDLDLRLRGRPAQVRLELGTVWRGGVPDHNRANDSYQVLVLDTGDAYSF